jgi:hypothetical protein
MKGNKRNMAEEEKYLKRMIELKGENGTIENGYKISVSFKVR